MAELVVLSAYFRDRSRPCGTWPASAGMGKVESPGSNLRLAGPRWREDAMTWSSCVALGIFGHAAPAYSAVHRLMTRRTPHRKSSRESARRRGGAKLSKTADGRPRHGDDGRPPLPSLPSPAVEPLCRHVAPTQEAAGARSCRRLRHLERFDSTIDGATIARTVGW